MQQQPPTQMIPMMSSFPQTNITTEQIQKYLDENKKLILAILDNQNLGKLAECAQYQAQLQKNLMYLAAIADAQPPTPTIPPQMSSHPAMQQAGYYMQHPQVSTKAPQPGISPPKMPMQFNSPHSIQDPQQLHQQHQQAMHGQMGVRSMGHNNVMHPMHHTETTVGAGGSGGPPSVGPNESRGGSNQCTSDAGTTGAVGHGSGDRKEAI